MIFRNPAKEKLRAGEPVVGFNVFECLLPPSPCSGNLPIGPPGPPVPAERGVQEPAVNPPSTTMP